VLLGCFSLFKLVFTDASIFSFNTGLVAQEMLGRQRCRRVRIKGRRRQRIQWLSIQCRVMGRRRDGEDMMSFMMNNLQRALILAAVAVVSVVSASASAAVLVDDYSIPAVAGGLSSNGLLGPVLRTDLLPSPVPYAFPARDANVTANAGGLVTATIGSGNLVNASSSLAGGALTLTYYGGPPVNFFAGGASQLDLDFFSIFPVIPNSMSVVATVNGLNSSLPQNLLFSASPQTISIPFGSFAVPAGLAAVSTLQLTFNFGSAGFFTLDSVEIPTAPPIGAVPEPAAVCVWLLIGMCGVGLVKFGQKSLGNVLRG
jgi:hypothetical protein